MLRCRRSSTGCARGSATTLPLTWAWLYSAAAAFSVLMYARLIQTQLFKYRFAFVEAIIAEQRPAAGAGEAAP